MDQRQKKLDAKQMQEWERKWADNANAVVKHMQEGGWSPWTSIDRYQMALQSIPLGIYEKRAEGGFSGYNPLADQREAVFDQAVGAAEAGRALPSAWTRLYGKP